MSETARRLTDLLIDLHETMDLEIKGWLDLATPDHQAKLAKAIIAMANHGGGYVAIGFDEQPGLPATPSPGRPSSLAGYNRDRVNGITEKYLEPAVHCEVHHVRAPDGADYPLIVIPGGHHIPIMAKRDGPSGGELKHRATYIRRAGPKSEEPRTAQEMSVLFDRCFANRRDDVGNLIRGILSGSMPTGLSFVLAAVDATPPRINSWIGEGCDRHAALTRSLPPDDARRFPRGYFLCAYQLREALRSVSAAELLGVLRTKTPRHTGWPPWWIPTRPGIAPYSSGGAIECLLADGDSRDAAHSDFWRLSPDGFAFLMRGYQEDGPDVANMGFVPGRVIDVTLPVWRVGEALLHAQALASIVGDGQAEVVFRVNYTGLAGRSLASISRDRLMFEGRYVSRQDSIVLNSTVEVSAIQDGLPEIVLPFLQPLYELFDFFRLPMSLVQEELAKMKSGRF